MQGYWENADQKKISLQYLEDAVIFKSSIITTEIDSVSGRFYFRIPLDHPVKLQLLNQFFVAMPNDTISVNINKNLKGEISIDFMNAVEKEASFFPLLSAEIKRVSIRDFSFDNSASIKGYKEAVTAHYNKAIHFLEQHSLHYSSDGKVLIKNLLSIEHLKDMINPIYIEKILKEQLPPGYFSEIDFSLLNKDDLLYFREYVIFLNNFNECFYNIKSPKGKYYDSAYVGKKISSAQANFAGRVRDHLLLFIYNSLVENGTKHNKAQVEELYNWVTRAFKKNETRLRQIRDMKHQFDILNKPFPPNILSQQLISSQGKKVFLSEIFSTQRIIHIDFWASWCGPCIAEMPKEIQLIAELKNKGIDFIFISLDKTEKPWQQAMQKIGIKENQYRLSAAFDASLMKYLGINTIPKYAIIGKNGSLMSYDAPRPSVILEDNSKLFSLLK